MLVKMKANIMNIIPLRFRFRFRFRNNTESFRAR